MAARAGARAHLVDDAGEVELAWLAGARTIGITAGASAPAGAGRRVVAAWPASGRSPIEERRDVVDEDVRFTLPEEVS